MLKRQEQALSRLASQERPWQDFHSPEAVLQKALDEALALGGFRRGLALLEDGRGGDLGLAAARGLEDAELAGLRREPLKRHGAAGLLEALRLEHPPREALAAHAGLAGCFPQRLGALVGLPLTERGRLRGLLLLADATEADEVHRRLFHDLGPLLASQAAGALRGAQLYQRLVSRTRELERTVAELTKARHRAELVTFAGAVAHEIRNPLSVVSAHVDLMREQALRDGQPAETLDLLAKKVGEANATVQQLLELSRPLALRPGPTALAPLVESFARFIQPKCRLQGVELLCSVVAGLPLVWVDADALQRCLLDLCLNSLQMSPPPGRLALEAAPRSGGVALSVSDNGPGIPDAMLPSLFEPFASGRSGGTGLGLYNVRRICREMGSSVLAGNLVDGGSRFCLFLRDQSAVRPPDGGESAHDPE